MKILIIGPIPPKYGGKGYGGIATHITSLATQLAKHRHEVFLWYHKPIKSTEEGKVRVIGNSFSSFLGCLISLKWLYKKKYPYLTNSQGFLLSYQIQQLNKLVSKTNFDVIHVHSLHNTSLLALRELNYPSSKIVATDHGFWNQSNALNSTSFTYKKLRKSVEGCSKVIYISEYAKKMHSKIDLGINEKLVKIGNPIHIIEYDYKKSEDQEKKTIFFNGITKSIKIKNLPVLLDAIQKNDTLMEKVKLIAIVNSEGKELIKKNNYGFDIEVLGKTDWDTVVSIYQKSDILVVPSKSDSFGLVYLEALMFGVPIIGLTQLVDEFENMLKTYIGEGFDSNTESSDTLGRKMISVLNHKIDKERIHKRLTEIYSWQNNVNKYEEVYKSIVR